MIVSTNPPTASRKVTAFRLTMTLAVASVALMLWPLRQLRIRLDKRPLSLWTGTPVLTLPIKARAERRLGMDARSLVLSQTYITTSFDINLSAFVASPIVGRFVPYLTFLWACVRARRVHSFCDRGLLPGFSHLTYNPVEPWIYRLIGVDLFVWTYGADVRSREATLSLGNSNCCVDCTEVGRACICVDHVRRRNISRLTRLARGIFAMGDMIEYVEQGRNDLHFWPVDIAAEEGRRYAPRYPAIDSTEPLRVVHAPNHRNFKGTRFLERAVQQLQAEGVAVELVMVERVPNAQAIEIYRSADVVFDQCLIGFHGYFALEAMALGKPVMCFIRKESYLLDPASCPIVRISTLTIASTLRKLAQDRVALREIGLRGRAYVETHFTIEAFSQRLGHALDEIAPIRART